MDTNKCLYENATPCSNSSCSLSLRINSTHPDIIKNGEATVVGIQVQEYYACTCLDSEYHHSSLVSGLISNVAKKLSTCNCLNGGTCSVETDSTVCTCPDNINYGPKCELLTARSVHGYSWFEGLQRCEDSTLSVSFESDESQGVLLYNGPIQARPYPDYPRDFVYMLIDNTELISYLELGSGTMVLSVTISENIVGPMTASLSWDSQNVYLEVTNCGNNTGSYRNNICRTSSPLKGSADSRKFLFNTGGPLQLGGMSAMPSFTTLAQSYGWSTVPRAVPYFSGCFSRLQFNDRIYDMNSTDFYKNFYRTCNNVLVSPIVQLGAESIIIICVSLLLLLCEYSSTLSVYHSCCCSVSIHHHYVCFTHAAAE